MKRAIVYASVMASFCVEDFSLAKLKSINHLDIAMRVDIFKDMTHFGRCNYSPYIFQGEFLNYQTYHTRATHLIQSMIHDTLYQNMIVKLCYDDYSFLPDRRYNNLSLLSGYLLRLYAKMASRVDF